MKTLVEKVEQYLGVPLNDEAKALLEKSEKEAEELGLLKSDIYETWIEEIKKAIDHFTKKPLC